MTTILACRKNNKICIGADTLITSADMKKQKKDTGHSKLINYKDSIFAFSGSTAYHLPLKLFLGKTQPTFKKDTCMELFEFFNEFRIFLERDCGLNPRPESEFNETTAFIYADKTGIWTVDSYRSALEAKKYAAIGSGREFALGAATAMYNIASSSRNVVEASLKATCELDVWSSLPLDIFEL